jgi:hypothetical protein
MVNTVCPYLHGLCCIRILFRADGGGSTEAAAREAAYSNLCSQLVPAERLSCLTEFFPSVDDYGFECNYGHLIRRTKHSISLDIFSGPSLKALFRLVTAYADSYDCLMVELILSLMPDTEVQLECTLDAVTTLWTSTVTLGIDKLEEFFFSKETGFTMRSF